MRAIDFRIDYTSLNKLRDQKKRNTFFISHLIEELRELKFFSMKFPLFESVRDFSGGILKIFIQKHFNK